MLKYFGDELVITSPGKWCWTILVPCCRISHSSMHICSWGRVCSLNKKVKKMCLKSERFQWAPAEMKSDSFSSQSGKECVASSPAAGSQSSHLSWQCYRQSIFHMDKSFFGVPAVGTAKVSSSLAGLSSPKTAHFIKGCSWYCFIARIKSGTIKCLFCLSLF